MKTLLLLFLSLFLLQACHSQSNRLTIIEIDNPICDETEVKMSGEKSIKVVTSNDIVLTKLMQAYGNEAKSWSKKTKKDRHGGYEEATVIFPSTMTAKVVNLLKSLNQKTNK